MSSPLSIIRLDWRHHSLFSSWRNDASATRPYRSRVSRLNFARRNSMRVLITGAGGFIGSNLVQALQTAGHLTNRDGTPQVIERMLLVDSCLPSRPDNTCEHIQGDISD